MSANNIDLMCLYWTSAGYHPDESGISRFGFRDRVEAAAKAGFTGVGIWHEDLKHVLEKMSLREMKSILDDNGIKYLELEFLLNWFLDGEKRRESDKLRKQLFEASGILQAKHVKIGDFYRSITPMPKLIEEFALLCKQAEDYGATIGFEVMEVSMVNTLKEAMEMIEGAGPKNGGIIIDIVQQVNIGMSFEELSKIPLKYLLGIELDDGLLPGSPGHGKTDRLYCGEGEFDIKGFVECIKNMGYTGPWAVEVINREYAKQPLDQLCERAYNTTIKYIA